MVLEKFITKLYRLLIKNKEYLKIVTKTIRTKGKETKLQSFLNGKRRQEDEGTRKRVRREIRELEGGRVVKKKAKCESNLLY